MLSFAFLNFTSSTSEIEHSPLRKKLKNPLPNDISSYIASFICDHAGLCVSKDWNRMIEKNFINIFITYEDFLDNDFSFQSPLKNIIAEAISLYKPSQALTSEDTFIRKKNVVKYVYMDVMRTAQNYDEGMHFIKITAKEYSPFCIERLELISDFSFQKYSMMESELLASSPERLHYIKLHVSTVKKDKEKNIVITVSKALKSTNNKSNH